ncbi:MAG: hypothetical protein ACOYJ1_11115 [Peptococcales bacterium]|jgi:hypothetical protein
MNRVEVQAYHIPKKYRCDLCDRIDKIEKRLVIWQENQVIGDLLLCNPCLDVVVKIIRGEQEVIEEWSF